MTWSLAENCNRPFNFNVSIFYSFSNVRVPYNTSHVVVLNVVHNYGNETMLLVLWLFSDVNAFMAWSVSSIESHANLRVLVSPSPSGDIHS